MVNALKFGAVRRYVVENPTLPQGIRARILAALLYSGESEQTHQRLEDRIRQDYPGKRTYGDTDNLDTHMAGDVFVLRTGNANERLVVDGDDLDSIQPDIERIQDDACLPTALWVFSGSRFSLGNLIDTLDTRVTQEIRF
ncbi:MAG: hypothetical protein K2X01_01555 [Cyanobacteria bacterium]|nr:hypothetical protein [Cyanobacteriota bacterium]